MTTKISKKDKLNAMLQMWSVLRAINTERPWTSKHPDLVFMGKLQVELGKMLGISIENLNENEEEGESEPEKDAERRIMESDGNTKLLRGDISEAPTSEIVTKREESGVERHNEADGIREKGSRKYKKPDVEPPTPQ